MNRSTNQKQDDTFKERLVALYPQLFGLALRLCRNDADAHDLAQAAFERGLRYRSLFRSGESPDRWMSTILRRIFVDDYRTRQRRARVSLLHEHDAVTAAEPEAPPAWEDFTFADVQRALLFVDRVSREIFRAGRDRAAAVHVAKDGGDTRLPHPRQAAQDPRDRYLPVPSGSGAARERPERSGAAARDGGGPAGEQ
jgi:DNA-directed RNA polymerase specialized sigma24 family protein